MPLARLTAACPVVEYLRILPCTSYDPMILMGTPFLKIMLILKIFVESQLEVGLLRVTDNNESSSRAHHPTEFSVLS